jgi:N-acetylneuraminic acid mutarotase
VNDVFCSDRSGHLYSGGAGPNTMYQYDTLTNSWASLPNMPISTGNSGTCTVTDTGWLYVDNGSGGMARLQLF